MFSRTIPALVTALCLIVASATRAQDNPENTAAQPTQAEPVPTPQSNEYIIGAMPEDPRGEYYESPLKKFGLNLFLAPYVIGAFASLIYLVTVYPVQALVGSSHVEGVMPWLLVPILGPWMAQYTRHVKDEPVWRGVLIADAALQATGALLACIGELLSGWRELPPPNTKAGLQIQFGIGHNGAAMLNMTLRTM